MSKQPRRVYIEKRDTQKKRVYRLEVGVAWPRNKAGDLNIDIHPGISVSGRIVCTAPKAAGKADKDLAGDAWFALSD